MRKLEKLARWVPPGFPLKRELTFYGWAAEFLYRLDEYQPAAVHRALALDPTQEQARQYASLVEEILDFRYKDIYNP